MIKRDLISITDLNVNEIIALIKNTFILKERQKKGIKYQPLIGKSLGMIFQKPSTRTSTSFAVAMYHLGGLPIMFGSKDLQMGRGESMSDTARVLDRYLDIIMIRANRHTEVQSLAQNASIPVINGLTDKEHPCQILADIFTLIEKLDDPKKNLKQKLSRDFFKELKVVFVGDSNNVANSWILASVMLGINFIMACPEGFEPGKSTLSMANEVSKKSGVKFEVSHDLMAAVKNANVIYTDVWTSMGKEDEQEKRKNAFKDFQVNEKLMEAAGKKAIVMHCLPAKRGEEITAGVVDGPQSVVFDQAENRLHIQKAILLALSGKWEV